MPSEKSKGDIRMVDKKKYESKSLKLVLFEMVIDGRLPADPADCGPAYVPPDKPRCDLTVEEYDRLREQFGPAP